MSTAFLYRYLVYPFKTTRDYAHYSPKFEGVSVLALLGLSQGASLGSSFFIVTGILFTLIMMFFIFVQSLVFDFTAQLLKHSGQSVRLYHWLSLSCAPFLINIPLQLLKLAHFPFNPGIGLLGVAATVLSMVLQIHSIRVLYAMSLRRALFVYFILVIMIAGVVGLLVAGTTMVSVLFLRGFF